VRVTVVVHPRAARERREWDGEELRLWITQPPIDSAANAAVIRIVADWLGLSKSQVRLVAGRRGRRKLVDVDGIERLPD
jgi:uncharacterized protein